MLKRLLEVFSPQEEKQPVPDELRIPLAAAVLMLEVAHADGEFCADEQALIGPLLSEQFNVSSEYQQELLELAHEAHQGSSDLHQFTREINFAFSQEEKEQIIETIWRLVYADGELDRYEDAVMRQIGSLIGLTHRQLIDAKLRVTNS